jgi:hypothetical protein
MPGLYPDNEVLEIFGEQVEWPGLGPDGKFTNGSFSNPQIKPSFIPADTINLILDNIQNVLLAAGIIPDNIDSDQLLKALQGKYSPRIVGEYHFLAYEPSVDELCKKRLLPLQYQLISVGLYQELCDKKWVGNDSNNAWLKKGPDGNFVQKIFPADGAPDESAGDLWSCDWWYKCDEDGTRNAGGSFMRVEDGRGMFYRGTGKNAIKKRADGTPYDGGAIGSVILDALQNIAGRVARIFDDSAAFDSTTLFYNAQPAGSLTHTVATTSSTHGYDFLFDASRVARTANETRPASVSVYVCVAY